MDGARGIAAWRWLFIIEGVATIGIAFLAFFILPNFPRTTTWLSEEERAFAVWRLEEDIGEDDWIDSEHQSFWQGAKLAFTDVKTYVLVSYIPVLFSALLLMDLNSGDGTTVLHRGERHGHQFLPYGRLDPWLQ